MCVCDRPTSHPDGVVQNVLAGRGEGMGMCSVFWGVFGNAGVGYEKFLEEARIVFNLVQPDSKASDIFHEREEFCVFRQASDVMSGFPVAK